jgi:hypothetical protein
MACVRAGRACAGRLEWDGTTAMVAGCRRRAGRRGNRNDEVGDGPDAGERARVGESFRGAPAR